MFEAISMVSLLAEDAPAEGSFLQSGTVFFLLMVAAIVGGYFLARFISQSMAVSEYGGRLAVVLVTALVAALIIFAQWPPKFGVDLRGGINMIGSLNLEALEDGGDAPTASEVIPALMARVNPSGTKEIMIRPLGKDKIEVTMPTVDKTEAEDIWKRLVSTGSLEFRIVANGADHAAATALAIQQAGLPTTTERNSRFVKNKEGVVVAKWVRLARLANQNTNQIEENAPFKYVPNFGASLLRNDRGEIVTVAGLRFGADPDLHGAELAKWAAENDYRSIELLVAEPDSSMDVQGGFIRSVSLQPDDKGRNSVAFSLSGEGARKMGKLTRLNTQRPMGIILDGEIHSAPNIESTIRSNGTITGNFSTKEVKDLIINLKSGKLSVALNKEPISTDFIESTLGNELKQKGIFAIGASLLLVLVFMVFYYRFAGFVASFALLLNLVLILALVMAIEYPFTLTGLAGLVLTVGMSVDANVLIFERIREETDRGAALRMAIRNGFDKATTTIVDANLTTLITAFVLYALGTEQIKGFAVTLILGILISMFTAIFVSRLVFDIWERKRWIEALNMRRIMEKVQIPFIEKSKATAFLSIALIVGGLASTFLLGGRILDQDLRGGSTARMVFNEPKSKEYVEKKLKELNVVYKPTGEKVDFNVASFGEGDDKDLKFKVDSNLPAWEGEGSGVEKYLELDEILADAFKGELLLHKVEVLSDSVSSNEPASQASPIVVKPSATGSRLSWNGVADVSIGSLTGGILVYQDPETGASTPSSGESTPSEGEAGVSSGQSAAPEGDQETEGTTPAQDPESTDSATETPLVGIQEGGVGEETEVNPRSDVTVTREMKVTPAIMGKSLVALLLEEADKLALGLTERNITVTTPDLVPGESSNSTVSENWSVEFLVSDEADADRLIESWAERFNVTPYFPTSSSVGSQIAEKTMSDAGVAIVISLIGIIGYCWFRFQNLAFGLAAVIALIHDVLIVVGAIAISHWLGFLSFLGIEDFKISLEVIAALLTVIGYSLNDTIVVFDRIREVRGKRTEITEDIINTSISQTLSRTILTSVTTFIVVFILYWFGGPAIHGFAFALVVGVIVGTYSSIFVASPALLWLMNTVGLNPGEVEEVAPAKG